MAAISYDEQGRLLPFEEPHHNSSRRSHLTFWKLSANLALLLADWIPGRRSGAWLFDLYRWAQNRHELMFLPKPLTLLQKRENAAAFDEWIAAFRKQREKVS